MLGKSVRIPVWLIALGFLVGVGLTAAAAGRNPDFEPQDRPVSSYIFGFTVTDIYDRGVMVGEVDLGSRAARVGISRGDVILAVNGEPVLSSYDFEIIVYELEGRPAILTVSRMGQINRVIIDTR